MAARFTVLASGSTGNACLLQTGGFGLLIDCGIGPRTLATRLASCGLSWRHVHAAVLTHTHADHWKETTLAHLQRSGVPLYCHSSHHHVLAQYSAAFAGLRTAGLVTEFEASREFCTPWGVRVQPLAVSHDGGETFGFRLEGPPGLFGTSWAVGYVADLGCWTNSLAQALADVDLLAIEFNHDEEMQRRSGRPPALIQRVLGDRGHLSNRQAADLLRAILTASAHACLKHVVPLHLSRDCNRAELAVAAAAAVLGERTLQAGIHVHYAGAGGPSVELGPSPPGRRIARRKVTFPPPPALWEMPQADAG